MENINAELLSGIYQLSKTGMQAVQDVLPKVAHKELREELLEQYRDYQKAASESQQAILSYGELPKDLPPLSKAAMWGSVQLHTLIDSGPDKIAEIMINGTTKGIIDLTRHTGTCQSADPENLRYAEAFIANEQRHIENLKPFLKPLPV